jgi:ribose 5-phosphate isomerase B
MKLVIASDHAGFELKEKIRKFLLAQKYLVEDCGTFSEATANWVEYGAIAAAKVSADPENTVGILICGHRHVDCGQQVQKRARGALP